MAAFPAVSTSLNLCFFVYMEVIDHGQCLSIFQGGAKVNIERRKKKMARRKKEDRTI